MCGNAAIEAGDTGDTTSVKRAGTRSAGNTRENTITDVGNQGSRRFLRRESRLLRSSSDCKCLCVYGRHLEKLMSIPRFLSPFFAPLSIYPESATRYQSYPLRLPNSHGADGNSEAESRVRRYSDQLRLLSRRQSPQAARFFLSVWPSRFPESLFAVRGSDL